MSRHSSNGNQCNILVVLALEYRQGYPFFRGIISCYNHDQLEIPANPILSWLHIFLYLSLLQGNNGLFRQLYTHFRPLHVSDNIPLRWYIRVTPWHGNLICITDLLCVAQTAGILVIWDACGSCDITVMSLLFPILPTCNDFCEVN